MGESYYEHHNTQNFLELTYEELEDMNFKARALTDPAKAETAHVKYLSAEKRIKAVTVCFQTLKVVCICSITTNSFSLIR